MLKKFAAFLTLLLLLPSIAATPVYAEEPKSSKLDLAPNARSAILMDAGTGTIIYEKNAHDRLPPASITKIMTMLLVMEAVEQGKIRLDEKVHTSEHAASMGGSQIFLEPGEEMTVDDLLKGVAMASGNDASVALAEKIAGSEEAFVEMMNEKAKELGMKNTHFSNCSGLPDQDHYSSAYDIALMSRELVKYDLITQYTKKYQDYLRKNTDNPFWLVNTNKLVRFYPGADGLKTGFTNEARFCLSATAKRDHFRVIAVVLGEPDTKTRNAEVSKMFDHAFAQYTTVQIFKPGDTMGTVNIEKGQVRDLTLTAKQPYSVLLKKGDSAKGVRHELVVNEPIKAPVKAGQPIGKLVVYKGDQVLTEFRVDSPADIAKANFWTMLKRTGAKLLMLD
jgi:D-alanyl-D-alanine carboxypeptidase (penicillin-binding protein 5/6)